MQDVEYICNLMAGDLPDWSKRKRIIDLKNYLFYNNVSDLCRIKKLPIARIGRELSRYGVADDRYKPCILKEFKEVTGLIDENDGRSFNIVLRLVLENQSHGLLVYMDGERKLINFFKLEQYVKI